jgi:hypothetical protein
MLHFAGRNHISEQFLFAGDSFSSSSTDHRLSIFQKCRGAAESNGTVDFQYRLPNLRCAINIQPSFDNV